jgi:translation initiation factor IF-2
MKKKQAVEISSRPPVVAVLGHVDHGKTSLLDYIRHAHVAEKEFGGITQHIGAYQTKVKNKDEERNITFIDTPGHEAFAKMRSRGATAADIAILVVAADDSVKPQTIDSIRQIQDAKTPIIVAINKMDLEGANVQKVKQDLAKYGVQVEGFGGDVPWIGVSAKTGAGIPELLDLIVLVWDMLEKEPIQDIFSGNVIETKVDKGKGIVASVIVKHGILKPGVKLYQEDMFLGKVRGMFDEYGQQVKEALPGKPVALLGFDTMPTIGAVLSEIPTSQSSVGASNQSVLQNQMKKPFLPDFLKPIAEQEEEKLIIILKTDTAGSMEAIKAAFPEKIQIVSEGYGDINEADILSARSNKAFVVGFNVQCKGSAAKLADTEKVVYRTYTIIYELLDEMADVVAGMKEVISGEREMGQGDILASFPFDGMQVAGTRVTQGRLAKGDLVKIIRGEEEIGRAKIKSLRQGKLEVTKVESGNECGVLFDKTLAFQVKDAIISYIK